MRETAGLGEQALNKIAEMALASQLKDAGALEVRIKTDLSKLARGEVESIAIKIAGLLMQANLRLEQLQLHINRVTVKPFNALFGKIELTHPSDGTVNAVINEGSLSHALNTQLLSQNSQQKQGLAKTKIGEIHIQQVRCYFLTDGHVVFNCDAILKTTNEAQSFAFTATPCIGMEGRKIVFQEVRDVEGKEPPSELATALLTQASEILSLPEFEEKGMSLQFQELDLAAGKLTWQAAAHIEQFPSA